MRLYADPIWLRSARGGVNLAGHHDLTDHEGTFLSLVLRIQPATAYQVTKIYEESPVSNFNTSKGKIYPLIRRLAERGLLAKRPVPGDGRGAEELLCTAEGEKAVREWVTRIQRNHILLEDPLRTRIQSFHLLSREEQIAWIVEVKEQLHAKLAELESYRKEVDVPFKEFVHDNAIQSVRARMDWLDRMLFGIMHRRAG